MAANGGRTQTNAQGLLWNGQWPTMNLFKQGKTWAFNSNPTDATAPRIPSIELDSNGYPTSIVGGTGGVISTFFLFAVAYYNSGYAITWDGNGTLVVPGNGTTTGFIPKAGYSFSNLTSSTGSGRFEFTLQNDAVTPSISITAVGSPGISNIRVFRTANTPVSDEVRLSQGLRLTPEFTTAMKTTCKFGVFRCLSWLGSSANGMNDTNMAVWADRTPRTFYSWRAERYDPSWHLGRTTRSGNTFIVSGGPTITDKMKVSVLADGAASNATSTTATSVTNSSVTGAPAVWAVINHGMSNGDIVTSVNPPSPFVSGARYYVVNSIANTSFELSATKGGSSISTTAAGTNVAVAQWISLSIDGGTTNKIAAVAYFPESTNTSVAFSVNKPAANLMTVFTYDQATDLWVGGFRASAEDKGMLGGCPPEEFIDVCNELGMDPHIPAGHLMMETGASIHSVTDFLPSWAQYVHDTYPSMHPYFEPCNETWGPGPSLVFRADYYTVAVAFSRWGISASAPYEVYGKWASTLGQAISAVYGNDRTRYSVICAFQTGALNTPNGTQDAKLTAAKYVSSNSGDPAYKWVDRVCGATYFNPAERYNPKEVVDGYAYTVTYAADSVTQNQIVEAYAATSGSSVSATREYMITALQNIANKAAAQPAGHTIKGLVAYEGGYSPDYLSGNWTTAITGISKASNGVISFSTNSANPENGTVPGTAPYVIPAVVGMSVSLAGIAGMTELNPTLTFTNGSASIAATNKFVAGQRLTLALSGSPASLPTGFSTGTTYYVIATGLSGSAFQLSATLGGSAIVAGSVPTGTQIANTLATVTKVGVADSLLSHQAAIDVDTSGMTTWTSGGTATWVNSATYSNNLRKAGKFAYNTGVQTQLMMQAFYAITPTPAITGWVVENYSNFIMSGNMGSGGTVWPMLDPDLVSVPRTYQTDVVGLFNNRKRRLTW